MEEIKVNLHFNPGQPCFSCGRMTNLGTYEPPVRYEDGKYPSRSTPTLYAYCPTHNYSESYPSYEQLHCIRRFIHDQLGNGQIRDITQLPNITKDAPGESGYVKEDNWRDYCWRFVFSSRQVEEEVMYVVYSIDDLQFYLVRPNILSNQAIMEN